MASKMIFTVYTEEEYELMLKTKQPWEEIVLETDPEEIRKHLSTKDISLVYLMSINNAVMSGDRAAEDTIVKGVYKVISIYEEEPRVGMVQDHPKRFMANAFWKINLDDEFNQDFKVQVRLNPLFNFVSKFKFNPRLQLNREKIRENFDLLVGKNLHVKSIKAVDDVRYPIKDARGTGHSTTQTPIPVCKHNATLFQIEKEANIFLKYAWSLYSFLLLLRVFYSVKKAWLRQL